MARVLDPGREFSREVREYSGKARRFYEQAYQSVGQLGRTAYSKALSWLLPAIKAIRLRTRALDEARALLSHEAAARRAGIDLKRELLEGRGQAEIPSTPHLPAGETWVNMYFWSKDETGADQKRWITFSRSHLPTWDELETEKARILAILRHHYPQWGLSTENAEYTLFIHRVEHGTGNPPVR